MCIRDRVSTQSTWGSYAETSVQERPHSSMFERIQNRNPNASTFDERRPGSKQKRLNSNFERKKSSSNIKASLPMKVDNFGGSEEPPAHMTDSDIGLWISGKCTCGRCRWGLENPYKDKALFMKSVYQKEFKEFENSPVSATIRQDKFHFAPHHSTVAMQTTMKSDFKQWPDVKAKILSPPALTTDGAPLYSRTTYKNEFPNWGPAEVHHFKRPVHKSTLNIPFQGNSSYQEKFVQKSYSIERADHQTARDPIGTDFPFVASTTYKTFHQPYKVKSIMSVKQKESYDKIPAFSGQYQSLNQRDFNEKEKPPCPARQLLKSLVKRSLRAKRYLQN
eukprot:TRINITY_DN8720_c0_g1_i3.p1 TRINITY_DN8720_c0_g1~~TRINITY_DN8720_c0_g1_i3.p1  ORF type:complete len:334 (+),score=30.85 TRINITY_DN8720_c0_g1_i3:61-1062(+)